MAQLPPDGEWLVQQMDGQVVLFNRYDEREIVRFDPADHNVTAQMQFVIHVCAELTPEQKVFAHFWCGYFHAYAGGLQP